jgi:diguanylate cyclase (GGDEF)-like protein
MVHEAKLSSVLSDFARNLATNYPIQHILDHLVQRIVAILPITGAGVTLISDGTAPRYVAASDEAALRFERMQTDIWQGPCLSAFESGDAVAIPDLSRDERYPKFSPEAVAGGLAAVFTFPLNHAGGRLGSLDLYRDVPGGLDDDDMVAAQTLADVAAAYLLNAQARDEARMTSDRFRDSSMRDPLTGLANRTLLHLYLEHAARRARRSHANAAVLFLDLDRFRQVNDTHGRQIGDQVLIAVAHRLSGLIRPGDTLARVAGDKFAVLCEDMNGPADVENLAKRITTAFATNFILPATNSGPANSEPANSELTIELAITATVGLAFVGPGQDISQDQIVEADAAMYQVKHETRHDAGAAPGVAAHGVIDLREAVQANDPNELERALREALAHDQLDVAYQPIVRSSDGMLTGVEALLRWPRPEGQFVSIIALIGVAEQSGLIVQIGAWVLEQACRARGNWLAAHPGAPLELAVNVSARQLMSADFTATIASILSRTGMDPHALVLEITENVFVEDSEHATTVLADLKTLGIRLALDDFGTGYSSLSYLRRLPIDIVKIDQSFIADIGYTPSGRTIVAAVTDLAHGLGLTVVAEGVETPSQRDEVQAIGCESSQGYFYARPMPATDIDTHLTTPSATPPRLPALAASR